MSLFVLSIYAFFGVMFIVMASTTIYAIEHALQRKPKKEGDRGLKFKKGRTKRKEKHVTLKIVPEKPLTEVVERDQNLEKTLKEIDQKLDKHTDLEICLKKLNDLKSEHPKDSQIVWMIGKNYQKMVEKTEDTNEQKIKIDKGIEACQASLDMNYNQPGAHKWMAVLIGYKGQFLATREKIQSGKSFKNHLEAAVSMDSNDPELQHMTGRFCFEISSLRWFERKIANAVFSEPPNCSFDKALEHFLVSEKLDKLGNKENRLFIAKCYIEKQDYPNAVAWLNKAKITQDDFPDGKVDREVNNLLEKYSGKT